MSLWFNNQLLLYGARMLANPLWNSSCWMYCMLGDGHSLKARSSSWMQLRLKWLRGGQPLETLGTWARHMTQEDLLKALVQYCQWRPNNSIRPIRFCWNRNRSSGSLVEERQPWMSPTYDSNMNSKHNGFIHSVPHLSQSITISNVVHLNCHMHCIIVTSNTWHPRCCSTHPYRNTSMT